MHAYPDQFSVYAQIYETRPDYCSILLPMTAGGSPFLSYCLAKEDETALECKQGCPV